MNNVKFPRVLVLSHNCFSRQGSNGRTLSGFFHNWPEDAIAQFYIHDETPDFSVTTNYYRILDVDVLRAFLYTESPGRRINGDSAAAQKTRRFVDGKKIISFLLPDKNGLGYLARNLVWDIGRWKEPGFREWLDEFEPKVILLQVGDYPFMFKIALDIATSRDIPLILYNCEDYYFKDSSTFDPLLLLHRRRYKKCFEEIVSKASYTVYITEYLRMIYDERFRHPSSVIMTSSGTLPAEIISPEPDGFRASYIGNLGVGRHIPLCEIGDALHEIDNSLKLDVYGRIPNEKVKSRLNGCPSINCHGLISYDEVGEVIQNSNLLIHAENFSDYYRKDLKQSFSSKIPDSLSSGRCFFLYAPEGCAAVRYLRNYEVGSVATNREELAEELADLIKNSSRRKHFAEKALELAREKHNPKKNSEAFRKIVVAVCKMGRNI